MATIALDICNTLCDINKVLHRALGPNPNPSNYSHPGVTPDFFIENLWVFEKAGVFSNAVEVVNSLAKYHNIIYLTARPKEARSVTTKWLSANGFPAAPLIMTNQKAEVAKKLGVTLAIDDAPHEIMSLKGVTNVLIHTQPYNYGMGKLFTWDEPYLVEIIEDIISSQRTFKPKARFAY